MFFQKTQYWQMQLFIGSSLGGRYVLSKKAISVKATRFPSHVQEIIKAQQILPLICKTMNRANFCYMYKISCEHSP